LLPVLPGVGARRQASIARPSQCSTRVPVTSCGYIRYCPTAHYVTRQLPDLPGINLELDEVSNLSLHAVQFRHLVPPTIHWSRPQPAFAPRAHAPPPSRHAPSVSERSPSDAFLSAGAGAPACPTVSATVGVYSSLPVEVGRKPWAARCRLRRLWRVRDVETLDSPMAVGRTWRSRGICEGRWSA